MKVGLDVMGGDFAPDAILEGAVLAREVLSDSDAIVLIGDQKIISQYFRSHGLSLEKIEVVHASEVIGMGEPPIKAYTKKQESSIAIGFQLLKAGKIQAFASAGNSGAMLVGSIYSVNAIQGVIRPATLSILPQENGGINVLLDIGTNPDARTDVMMQFGILGSLYIEHLYGIVNPRVALLNIGEEEEKGNLVCQSTFQLLKNTEGINFIGNIEPRDLFRDKCDVVVCDGFTGNIVLKLIEAMYRISAKRGLVDEFIDRLNYENYGGSPILGINGTVILGHGISNKTAIKNMVLLARDVYATGLPAKIHDRFHIMKESSTENTLSE